MPNHMKRVVVVLVVALGLVVSVSGQAPVKCKGPLLLEQVVGLARNEVPEARLRQIVRECGVGFPFDSGTEGVLRAAGASEGVIAAVRAAAPATTPPSPSYPSPTSSAARAVERRTFGDGEYVWVPGGTFMMGCTPGDTECDGDESPRHAVTLTRGFWMSRTETTVGQYRRSGKSAPVPSFAQTDDHPVVNVSWHDADAYCRSVGGRLPTEAEWERAARGGHDEWRYPWGNSISHENANYSGTGGRDRWEYTSPVGSFPANEYGLVDMAGNVEEWCADSNRTYGSGATDPNGGARSGRALRGGSWLYFLGSLRVSYRHSVAPVLGDVYYGFRCVRDASP